MQIAATMPLLPATLKDDRGGVHGDHGLVIASS